MKERPVTEGYKGIIRIKDCEDILPEYRGAFVELSPGMEITGNPDHYISFKGYRTLQDLRKRMNPVLSHSVRVDEKYLVKYAENKKNNYW